MGKLTWRGVAYRSVCRFSAFEFCYSLIVIIFMDTKFIKQEINCVNGTFQESLTNVVLLEF